MTITLNTKEFDEAVLLWLQEQGFSTDRYNISTRVIAGRTDSGVGARMDVTLDPIQHTVSKLLTDTIGSAEVLQKFESVVATKAGPSFSRGHADE